MGCSKDTLKEALVALADKIETDFGFSKVTLAIDGAARGNPGEAGAGAALVDSHGNVLAERSQYLGKATNNEAEYQALIFGLKLAIERGFSKLSIQTDSELLANQINGSYRIKEPRLKKLFVQAQELLSQMEKWEIQAIPRAQNRLADRLANLAIDNQTIPEL
ncbi:TPA: ribonuclease H [Candidatus Edwardsbacteria bacterium]|nr:ribonuclease H [Candidatus Edwardsbacteria bacterium]HBZ87098.1 ribonuclease H [Candidatus Edwardsbacteria bacterium]